MKTLGVLVLLAAVALLATDQRRCQAESQALGLVWRWGPLSGCWVRQGARWWPLD